VNPGVLDVLDHDENLRSAADVLGVPIKGIRDSKTVIAIREDRAAAEAEAADSAKDAADARAVKDLSAAKSKNPMGAPFPPGIPGTEVGKFGGEAPQA
jgi:hypothetical protein